MDNVAQLPQNLVLYTPAASALNVPVVQIAFTQSQNSPAACGLTLRVSPQLYQQIEATPLFNLRRELRGSLNALQFAPATDLEIEVALQSQLLPQLAEQASDSAAAIDYLVSLGAEPDQPLLCTESWLALRIRQSLESGEIGYRTFWSYLDPAALSPEAILNGQISQFSAAMEQFLRDRNSTDLEQVGKAISEAFAEITKNFQDWDETAWFKQTEAAIAELAAELFTDVTKAFEQVSFPDSPAVSSSPAATIGKIYRAMIQFFSEDDWAFTKLQGEPTLRLAFKGKTEQWDCYAKAIEDSQQFIFYSICAFLIPEHRQMAIVELLARLNSRLAIGNFEMNFDQKKVCFRTSIDVTGDRLSSALIKQLVYTNVVTTDHYLPGIQAVLNGASSAEVLRSIESDSRSDFKSDSID